MELFLDKRIIDALERFCSSRKYRSALIRISSDPFHNKEDYETAYSFYASLITDANNRIQRKNSSIGIGLECTSKKAALMYTLYYAGRATELIDSQYEKITHPFLMDTKTSGSEMKHRVKILGDVVPCAFSILANGNLSFSEATTFDKLDEISIGNITEQGISNLIDIHNEQCVILCSESSLLCNIDLNCRKKKQDKKDEIVTLLLEKIFYERIIMLRIRAKTLFPNVPVQTIIERIQFPSSMEISELAIKIYKNSPYYTENMIINIKKYKDSPKVKNYICAVYMIVSQYLKDKRIERKYPYWLFGNESDIDQHLTWLFEDLSLRYEADPEEATNDKAFACEPGEYCSIKYIDYGSTEHVDFWNIFPITIQAMIEDVKAEFDNANKRPAERQT